MSYEVPNEEQQNRRLRKDIAENRDLIRFTPSSTNADTVAIGAGSHDLSTGVKTGNLVLNPERHYESIQISWTGGSGTLNIGDVIKTTVALNTWEGKFVFQVSGNETAGTGIFEPQWLVESLSTPRSVFPTNATTLNEVSTPAKWTANYTNNTVSNYHVVTQSASMIMDKMEGGNPSIKNIFGAKGDGQFTTIKPKEGKTLVLKPNGNIDVSQDTNVLSTEIAILQFQEDNITPNSDGNWTLVSSGGGSGGNSIKTPCRVATTGNNVAPTAIGSTVDGVTIVVDDRVLYKDQTAQKDNGIYVCTNVALGVATMERASDMPNASTIEGGLLVYINEGTVNGDNLFGLTTNGSIVVGTNAQVWTNLTNSWVNTATSPLNMDGNAIFFDLKVNNKMSILYNGSNLNYTVDVDGGAHNFYVDDLSSPKIGITETKLESNVPLDMNLNYVEFQEISTPSTPSANHGFIYAKDVSGVTTPMWSNSAGETSLFTASNVAWSNVTIDVNKDMNQKQLTNLNAVTSTSDITATGFIFNTSSGTKPKITSSTNSQTMGFFVDGFESMSMTYDTFGGDKDGELVINGEALSPRFRMYNSESPAGGTTKAGRMYFDAKDSAGNIDTFAMIEAEATNYNSGSEQGEIDFQVRRGGTSTESVAIINQTGLHPPSGNSNNYNLGSMATAWNIVYGVGLVATKDNSPSQIDIYRHNSSLGNNEIGRINWYGDITGTSSNQMAFISSNVLDYSQGDGYIGFHVAINGTADTFFELYGDDPKIRFQKPLDLVRQAVPSDPASNATGKLFYNSTNNHLSFRKRNDANNAFETVDLESAGGGSQTPWTSDIDADNYALVDANNIQFRNSSQTAVSSTIPYIQFNNFDFIMNAPSDKGIELKIGGNGFISLVGNASADRVVQIQQRVDMNQNYIQFDGMSAPSTVSNEPLLFADSSNSSHLSIKTGAGDTIDLEASSGGAQFIAENNFQTNHSEYDLWYIVNMLTYQNAIMGNMTDSTPSTGKMYMYPIYLSETKTLKNISVFGHTGGSYRMKTAIYSNSTNGELYPSSRVWYQTGWNFLNFTGQSTSVASVNQSLTAGLYWVCFMFYSGSSTKIYTGNADWHNSVGWVDDDNPNTTGGVYGWIDDSAPNSFSSTMKSIGDSDIAPIKGSTGLIPILFMKW